MPLSLSIITPFPFAHDLELIHTFRPNAPNANNDSTSGDLHYVGRRCSKCAMQFLAKTCDVNAHRRDVGQAFLSVERARIAVTVLASSPGLNYSVT